MASFKHHPAKSKPENMDFFESIRREYEAVDKMKKRLSETEAKIQKHGQELRKEEIDRKIGDNKSNIKKRKIAWSDNKTETMEPMINMEAGADEVDQKETISSPKIQQTFFNTNAFDNFRDKVEYDLKNTSYFPNRLVTPTITSNKLSKTSITPNWQQPAVVRRNVSVNSSPVKVPCGILKVTRDNLQINLAESQHHYTSDKSFENTAVTSGLLKTNVTNWKVDGTTVNSLKDKSNHAVKEPSLKISNRIPDHMMMLAWEPIVQSENNVPTRDSSSIDVNSLVKVHDKDEGETIINIASRFPQKRASLITKTAKSDIAESHELQKRKELIKQKRIKCDPKKTEKSVITPPSRLKEKLKMSAEKESTEKEAIIKLENEAMPQNKKEMESSDTSMVDNSQNSVSKDKDIDSKDETLKEKAEYLPLPKPKKSVSLKRPIPKVEEPVRQSSPKVRHYDQASVRQYIKKQKEERRLKHQQDRLMEQAVAEEKKKKMDELQIRQKSLARTPMKVSRKSQKNNSKFNAENRLDTDSYSSSDLDEASSTDLLLNNNLQRFRSSKAEKLADVISAEKLEVPYETKADSNDLDVRVGDEEIHYNNDGLSNVNEQLKMLSAVYKESTDILLNSVNVKPAVIATDDNYVKKCDRIRNQAQHLQGLMDERMQHLQTKISAKLKLSAAKRVNNQQNEALSSMVSKVNKSTNTNEDKLPSSHSEINDFAQEPPSDILRQIALNTVKSKMKLNVDSEQKEEDWRHFLTANPPDPQNFVNSLTRKLKIDFNIAQNEDVQDNNTQVKPLVNADYERFSYAIASDRVETVATPTITQSSMEMELQSLNSAKENISQIDYDLQSQESFFQMSENKLSEKANSENSSNNSVNTFDDQLSEGPLSLSDFQAPIKVAEKNFNVDNQLVGRDNDTLSDQQSLPRDNFDDAENNMLPASSSKNSASNSSDDSNVDETGDHVLSHCAQNSIYMMSPNTLRLRLSTELMYLDNVHETLGQLHNVEKLRAISMAQRELPAVAKYNKKQSNPESSVKQNLEDNSSTSRYQVMQCQAEAIKTSAEATKQLAELNKSLLERRGENLGNANDITATVAATTSAAVTAALTQLKQKLQSTKRSRTKSDLTLQSSSSSEKHSKSTFENQPSSQRVETTSSSTIVEQTKASAKTVSDPSVAENIKSSVSNSVNNKHSLLDASIEEDLSQSENTPNTISELHVKHAITSKSTTPGIPERLVETSQALSESDSHQSFNETLHSGLINERENLSDSSYSSKLCERTSDNLLPNLGDKSFRQFTLAMVKQNMAEEEQRIKYQEALIKFREKALVDKTKAEFEWIKLKIRQATIKGDRDKVKHLKMQRDYLMDKYKQDHAELKSIKGQEKLASRKRRSILKQQEEVAQFYISSEDLAEKLNLSREGDEEMSDSSHHSSQKHSSRTSKSIVTEGSLSGHDGEFEDIKESSKKLKRIHSSKRYLSNKEQSIIQRRQTVEELIHWQQKLEKDENDVKTLEKEMFKMLNVKQRNFNRSQSSKGSSEGPLVDSKRGLLQRSVSKLTSSINNVQEKLESEVIATEIEDSIKSNTSIVDENSGDSESASATNLEASSIAAESASEKQSIGTLISAQSSPEHLDKEQDSTNLSLNSLKSKSIILREPLAPARTQTRRRRDSSGSEESGPISQSETASDLSDIEGRIFALKEELRRRRKEAEGLKKEQKRKTKDRLKTQETSLLKQIEALDRFIVQTKDDLQKELEEDSVSKVVVKPVIKTPKVAESKRLHRQSGLDRSPENDKLSISSAFIESSETLVSPKNDDFMDHDCLDGLIATVNVSFEENEEILESLKLEGGSTSMEFKSETSASNLSVDAIEKPTSTIERFEENKLEVDEIASVCSTEINESLDGSSSVAVSEGNSNANLSANLDETFIEVVDNKALNNNSLHDDDAHETVFTLGNLEIPENSKSNLSTNTKCLSVDVEGSKTSAANQLTETLLQELLFNEIKNALSCRNAHKTNQGVITKKSIQDLREDLSNRLFDDILQDSLDTALTIYKSSSKCENNHCENVIDTTNEFENGNVSKRELHFHHESYISQRVNDIMAEVNDKKSPASKTRPQDMFVLSFGDTTTSPDNNLSPTLDLPAKMEFSSPVKRPSSPVFGESGEPNLGNVDPTLGITTEMNPLYTDGLGEDEWFDDDFGLSDGQVRSADENQMRRYQVYPYQNYYYIREIPNKPPPPYTPPGQALATATTTSNTGTGLELSNTTGPVINKIDENKISNEIHRVVNYSGEHIKKLVNTATALIYAKIKDGVEVRLDEIEGYFTVEDMKDDANSRSRRFYKEFLLALIYEIVNDIYHTTRLPIKPVWYKPRTVSAKNVNLPKTLDDLLIVVYNKVTELLSHSNYPSKKKKLKWGRKKRDFVDEILLQELRMEENEWTTYNEDELMVKSQLSDLIFDSVILDTVNAVKQTWRRKFGGEDCLLVTDI